MNLADMLLHDYDFLNRYKQGQLMESDSKPSLKFFDAKSITKKETENPIKLKYTRQHF